MIVFENHSWPRMYCWKRFRIAALRKMSTPLGYNHCFWKSLRGWMYFWKRFRVAALREMSTSLSYNLYFWKSSRGSHVLLKTISHNIIEQHINHSQLQSLFFENHQGVRMYFWERFRVASLTKMATPLSYNHCLWDSMRASNVLLKTISHSGIEEHVNPSQLESLFLKMIQGLACTFENYFV